MVTDQSSAATCGVGHSKNSAGSRKRLDHDVGALQTASSQSRRTMIDTLALADALERKGMPRKQAEGVARALRDCVDGGRPLSIAVFESEFKAALASFENRLMWYMVVQSLVIIVATVALIKLL